MDFLTELFHLGLSYETINVARSALSSIGIIIDGFSAGQHSLVKRFCTGVFNLRPPKFKYLETWDVQQVIDYLKTLASVILLSLKMLTLKLAMLIAFTNATRAQTLQLMTLKDLKKGPDFFVVQLRGCLEQLRPGRPMPYIYLESYTPDRRLCVVNTLQEYIDRTYKLWGSEDSLSVSYLKPHSAVTSSTISRWLKTVMNLSGIDITVFKAHSVRAASTSKAKASSISIQDIMKVAGWTNAETFAQYYHKDIQQREFSYASTILSKQTREEIDIHYL